MVRRQGYRRGRPLDAVSPRNRVRWATMANYRRYRLPPTPPPQENSRRRSVEPKVSWPCVVNRVRSEA